MNLILNLYKEIDSTPKKVREFGILFFVILSVIIPLIILYKRDWAILWSSELYFASAGLFFLVLGLFAHSVLRPIYKGWMLFALLLGHFMTQVIIGLVYYLVMTPIGLIRIMTQKDPLNMRFDASKTSYWVDKVDNVSKERLTKLY